MRVIAASALRGGSCPMTVACIPADEIGRLEVLYK
jgi:hypothetical protein